MDFPEKIQAETFAASTGHGIEYGVTFYALGHEPGESEDSYGDLITIVDEKGDLSEGYITEAQARTMEFAQEISRRWNEYHS